MAPHAHQKAKPAYLQGRLYNLFDKPTNEKSNPTHQKAKPAIPKAPSTNPNI